MSEVKDFRMEEEAKEIKNLLFSGMSVEDENWLCLYLPVKDKSKCLKLPIFEFADDKFCMLYGNEAANRNLPSKIVDKLNFMANSIVYNNKDIGDFVHESRNFTFESVSKLKEANKTIALAYAMTEKENGFDLMDNNEVMQKVIENLGKVYCNELTIEECSVANVKFGKYCIKDSHNNFLVFQDGQIDAVKEGNSPAFGESLQYALANVEKFNVNFKDIPLVSFKDFIDDLRTLERNYVSDKKGFTDKEFKDYKDFSSRLYFKGKKISYDNMCKNIEKMNEQKLMQEKKEISRNRIRYKKNGMNKLLKLTDKFSEGLSH